MGDYRRYKPRNFDFAQLLLSLRRRANLTQEEVAFQLGVAEKSIRNWEGGSNYPTDVHLQALIELYLSLNAFTTGQEQDEARMLWVQLRESTPHRTRSFDERSFARVLSQWQATRTSQESHPQGSQPH